MVDEINEIGKKLKADYEEIDFRFLDILSDDMEEYNEILRMVDSGLVSLPVTIINDLPRFHGGLEYQDIKDVIDKKVDC